MTKIAFHVAIAAVALGATAAGAQVFNQPIYQLPSNDFTFNWGDLGKRTDKAFVDLRVSGIEEDFSCDLTMELAARSKLTDADMRDLAQQLSSGFTFIYDATMAMNAIDNRREIEWATLVCTKGSNAELDPDADARAEREAKARERALRAQQRRRERNNED